VENRSLVHQEKLKETGAPLAGEMSGHIFFKERWYGFDDGLYAGARLLEILSRSADPGAVLEELPDSISTPELQWQLGGGEKLHADGCVAEKCALRRFAGDHHHRRPARRIRRRLRSGTAIEHTPIIVLRFEAENTEALKRIQAEFRKALLSVKPGATLPFLKHGAERNVQTANGKIRIPRRSEKSR